MGVGNSTLFDTIDYGDTFTGTEDGGAAGRPYMAAVQPYPAYRIEHTFGNPAQVFAPHSFSFAADKPGTPGLVNGTPAYPGTSTAGSDTGFTQTGGGGLDFGIHYGLRDEYIVQFDAVQAVDRIDITSGTQRGNIFAPNSLSVFFRGDGSGNASLYNGVDTPISSQIPGFNTGITGAGQWHNYAVRFDRADKQLEIFIDEQSKGVIDLTTFAGGAYQNFSNAAVSVGYAGGDRLWTDNFQVGGQGAGPPAIPPIPSTPIPGLYNTGVDDSGVPLPDDTADPHYNLLGIDGAIVLPDATVFDGPPPPDLFPIPPWVLNSTTSRWIGPDDGPPNQAAAPEGNYAWEILFDMTGLRPETAIIRGLWGTDNGGVDILLNGVSTAQGKIDQFNGLTEFEVAAHLGHQFVDGLNSLIFLVNNLPATPNPTGLRVEGLTGGAEPIPEPSTIALAVAGTLGLLCLRRRS